MTEGVHAPRRAGRHRAGPQRAHRDASLYSREVPIGRRASAGLSGYYPVQARAMDKADIRDYRRWHREAALRAKRAGFDIVYCLCRPRQLAAMHFLQRRRNHRTDEYGGSLENRVRLLREMIEDARRPSATPAPSPVRFAVDELLGPDGISATWRKRASVVEMLAELPDLWDVNVSDWRQRFHDLALRAGRLAGAVHRLRQEADHASPWSASAASPRPTPWSRRSGAACST